MLRYALLVFVMAAFFSSSAHAVDVYINGTKVTGAVKDRAFQGVNLLFDAEGNVYINAPGYTVTAADTATAQEDSPTAGEAQYWIVVNNVQVGHYRVIVKVNGSKVADVASTQRQQLVNVSGAVKSGKNDVTLTFYPMPDAPKIQETEGTSILIGKGTEDNLGQLSVTQVLGKHEQKTGKVGAEEVTVPVVIP